MKLWKFGEDSEYSVTEVLAANTQPRKAFYTVLKLESNIGGGLHWSPNQDKSTFAKAKVDNKKALQS